MIRILLPTILMLLGLGGGIAAGVVMADRGNLAVGAQNLAQESIPPDDQLESRDGRSASTSGLEYVRLNNQFMIPVVRHGAVRSMVVLSLTIEVLQGQSDVVFQREPRLRDALLRVMFAHANSGGFDGSFTSSNAMMPLREGLREAAAEVLGDLVVDVLIIDIGRQDA